MLFNQNLVISPLKYEVIFMLTTIKNIFISLAITIIFMLVIALCSFIYALISFIIAYMLGINMDTGGVILMCLLIFIAIFIVVYKNLQIKRKCN
jgi:hypothetical protein